VGTIETEVGTADFHQVDTGFLPRISASAEHLMALVSLMLVNFDIFIVVCFFESLRRLSSYTRNDEYINHVPTLSIRSS
jgi:hypothetical protein